MHRTVVEAEAPVEVASEARRHKRDPSCALIVSCYFRFFRGTSQIIATWSAKHKTRNKTRKTRSCNRFAEIQRDQAELNEFWVGNSLGNSSACLRVNCWRQLMPRTGTRRALFSICFTCFSCVFVCLFGCQRTSLCVCFILFHSISMPMCFWWFSMCMFLVFRCCPCDAPRDGYRSASSASGWLMLDDVGYGGKMW